MRWKRRSRLWHSRRPNAETLRQRRQDRAGGLLSYLLLHAARLGRQLRVKTSVALCATGIRGVAAGVPGLVRPPRSDAPAGMAWPAARVNRPVRRPVHDRDNL